MAGVLRLLGASERAVSSLSHTCLGSVCAAGMLATKVTPETINHGVTGRARAYACNGTTYQARSHRHAYAAALLAVSTALAAPLVVDNRVALARSEKRSSEGEVKGDLPVIPRADVEDHTSVESGVWVTYGNGVYDVTEFVHAHPGGDRILLAAGGPLEPYWAMYAQHKQKEVIEILESMRIGILPEDERIAEVDDPYANDPPRDPRMCVQSQTPYNAETPVDVLMDFITPTELHFKRSHMPIPQILQDAYSLQVVSADGDVTSLTLDDLKNKFPAHTVTTTLQCAGNRRAEMSEAQHVNGLPWGSAAISTAEWRGARLKDVLAQVNAHPSAVAKHVEFVGLDCDMTGQRYGASIPIQKALAEEGDCLLAYEMNGKDIPREHGFPVRAIVPGTVAARCVKWVEKVVVRDDESESHWQQRDYKSFCPDSDWDHLDWATAPAIQETPVTSAIVAPLPDAVLEPDAREVHVEGYAFAGGGRGIIRVDVSADGGKTWVAATLRRHVGNGVTEYRRHWAWTHWEADVPIEACVGRKCDVELVCKAVDDSYNVQPDSFRPIYNARGVLANAWHRVQVSIRVIDPC